VAHFEFEKHEQQATTQPTTPFRK